jgi:ABC-type polysaccharide transport system permease subunit
VPGPERVWWCHLAGVVVLALFVTPIVFMLTGSLREAGLPPPRTLELLPTTYLPLFIYRNAFEFLRYGYAAAATLVMFVVTAVIVIIQYRIVKRWRKAFVV